MAHAVPSTAGRGRKLVSGLRSKVGAFPSESADLGVAASAAPPTKRPRKDRREFESAVRPLLGPLYRLSLALCRNRSEADDLLQDALVKAFTHVESFEGRGDLLAWMCQIVRNCHIETRRTTARRSSIFDRVVETWSATFGGFLAGHPERDPEQEVISGQHGDALLRCIRALPLEFRTVLMLCDVEELGYERVASVLGIPVGTVKSRHARGRARLRVAFLELERPSGK